MHHQENRRRVVPVRPVVPLGYCCEEGTRLTHTQVTDEGVKKLQQALPKFQIARRPLPLIERLSQKVVGRETTQKTTLFGTQIGAERVRPLLGGKVVP